jgi:hypothetical protein
MNYFSRNHGWLFATIIAVGLALPLQAFGFGWKNIKKKATSSVKSTKKKKANLNKATASPADYEIKSVRFSLKSLNKKMQKDAKWWANVEKNQYWVASDIKKIKKNLERIKKKDPNYSIADFQKEVAKVEARLATAKAAGANKKAHTKKIKKLAQEFRRDLKGIHAFWILTDSIKRQGRAHSNYTGKKKMLEAIAQLKPFAALLKKCRSTYDAAMADPDAWGRLAWRSIEKADRETCKWDLSERKQILLGYVLKRIDKADKGSVEYIKTYLKNLDSKGSWNYRVDREFASLDKKAAKDREYWKPLLEGFGKELPAKKFTAQIAYWKQHGKKAIAKAAKKSRFEKGKKRDSASLKLAKKSLKKMGFKVVKGVNTGNWTISKNHVGIPLDRYIGNRVMAKAKGEKFCRIYEFTTTQTYSGGGRWARGRTISSIDDQSTYLISRCR